MSAYLRRLTAVAACCLLLAGCSPDPGQLLPVSDGDGVARSIVPASATLPDETLEEHRLIARNGRFSLFLREDTLSLLLREEETGRLIRSAVDVPDENDQPAWTNFTRSGVAIEYYIESATTPQRADMLTKSPQKTVTRTDTGFAAQIVYTDLNIRFDLFVDLTEDGLTVEVPQASIQDPGRNKLAAIYLYPFMGYSFRGEREGYMVIPDGCGALISLEDHQGKYVQPYTSRIYGEDYGIEAPYEAAQSFDAVASTYLAPRQVTAPVFGMVHTDEAVGFLGVVEEGQYNAEIVAYPNGAVTQYNWITAKFLYRQTYIYPTTRTSGITTVQADRGTFDIRLRYLFVTGEQADYTGLALAYRQYLQEKGVLQSGAANQAPIQLDFFAGDVEESAWGYSFVSTTTLEQMTAICGKLRDEGMESALAVYKGWQPQGIYGAFPEGIRLQSSLGSRKQLQQAGQALTKDGVTLKLYSDPVNTYSNSRYGSGSYLYGLYERSLKLSTQLTLHPYRYQYTPQRSLSLLHNQREEAQELGLSGLALDGIGHTLSSSLQSGRFLSRQQAASLYVSGVPEKTALYAPCDYLWGSTAQYLDFPMETSNYQFVSEEVPFLAIALSGGMELYGSYVNFQADQDSYLLKLLSVGVFPSFLLMWEPSSALLYTDSRQLSSCGYEEYAEDILRFYQAFSELKAASDGTGIADYRMENGVSVTKFENGCLVYVNHSNDAVVTDGADLPARSYRIEGDCP